MKLNFRKMAMSLLIFFAGHAEAKLLKVVKSESKLEIEYQLPPFLLGNCNQHRGFGSVSAKPISNSFAYEYKCVLPNIIDRQDAMEIENLAPGKSSLVHFIFEDAKWIEKALGASTRSQIRKVSRPNGVFDIEFTVVCIAEIFGGPCDSDVITKNVDKLLMFLGHGKSSQNSGYASIDLQSANGQICIEEGSGYPDGPACLKYSSIDASGRYCKKTSPDYHSACLEYGSIIKYP